MCDLAKPPAISSEREEHYHESLKLEHLYWVLSSNRTELIQEVALSTVLQLREAAHEPA